MALENEPFISNVPIETSIQFGDSPAIFDDIRGYVQCIQIVGLQVLEHRFVDGFLLLRRGWANWAAACTVGLMIWVPEDACQSFL